MSYDGYGSWGQSNAYGRAVELDVVLLVLVVKRGR